MTILKIGISNLIWVNQNELSLIFLLVYKKLAAKKEIAVDASIKAKRRKQQQLPSSLSDASMQAADTDGGINDEVTVDLSCVVAAENKVDPKIQEFASVSVDPIRQVCLAADKQVTKIYKNNKNMLLLSEN